MPVVLFWFHFPVPGRCFIFVHTKAESCTVPCWLKQDASKSGAWFFPSLCLRLCVYRCMCMFVCIEMSVCIYVHVHTLVTCS